MRDVLGGLKGQYGGETSITRMASTYGLRIAANDGRVMTYLIVQGVEAKSMTMYGDSSQARPFCCVDDLIDRIVLLDTSDSSTNVPLNLGNLAITLQRRGNCYRNDRPRQSPLSTCLSWKKILKNANLT